MWLGPCRPVQIEDHSPAWPGHCQSQEPEDAGLLALGLFTSVFPRTRSEFTQPGSECLAEDGSGPGSSPCRTGWAQRADMCGRAVFCSDLAVINSRFPAVLLRSSGRNNELTYKIDIRLLLCGLDTANGKGGVQRHGSGVESPAGRLSRTKPVAWVVVEARGPERYG